MSVMQNEPYLIDQIRCPECSTTCIQKNIYRHMSQKHQWSNDDCKGLISAIRTEKKNREAKTSFVCSYCRALFRNIKHLLQHKRICVSQPLLLSGEDNDGLEEIYMEEMIVEGEEEVVENYQLENIQQEDVKPSTSSTKHPYELLIPPHRQNARPQHHSDQENPSIKFETKPLLPPMGPSVKYTQALTARHRGTHLTCPECNGSAESLEEFLNHCKEKHESVERKFVVERRLFETRDEFKKWFDQRQEDTCTSLTKRTGHGGETLYRCHRVGKYRSVAKSRKSNPRKIDQTCTAYLKVTLDEDGSTWATGCFTHIGHDLDHKLLWLTETQEYYVRELIDLGWTSDQIFFYIRNEYKEYECKLKYISKNDIRNITVRYNREKEKLGFLTENKPEKTRIMKSLLERSVPVPEDEEERIEKGVLDEEEYETKAKIPRLDKIEPLEEIEVQKVEEPVIVEHPEEVVVVVEEEEYINVVDDDSMPELEKIH